MTSIYLDISMLFKMATEGKCPTGATRVDYHITSYHLHRKSSKFIRWSAKQQQFVLVSKEDVSHILRAIDLLHQNAKQAGSETKAEVVSVEIYTDTTCHTPWTSNHRGSAYIIICLRNLSLKTWRRETTHLTTSLPLGRSSILVHKGWRSKSVPAMLDESKVKPHKVGTFKFPILIPRSKPCEEFFNVVINKNDPIPTGRVHIQLSPQTDNRIRQRLELGKLKLANRLLLARESLDRTPSLWGKIKLVLLKSGSVAKAKLKNNRIARRNKYIYHKLLGMYPQVLRVARAWHRSLSIISQRVLAVFRRLLLPHTILPRPRFAKDDVAIILTSLIDAGGNHLRAIDTICGQTRVVQLVHDILDITHPQFSHANILVPMKAYFARVLPQCFAIITTSDSNASLIKDQFKEWRKKVPAIVFCKPGNDFVQVDKIVKPKDVEHDAYILAVGSVEVRKNHTLLEQTYKLANERSIKLPHLYIAGMIGWLTHEFLERLTVDPVLKEKVTFIERPPDAQLAWLYKNSRLTVYPSFCEGWGLPINESLVYGKVTLCSRTTSMPEVGGKFADYFSPYSPEQLLKLLVKYNNDTELRSRVAQIKKGYRVTTWRKALVKFDTQLQTLITQPGDSSKQ